MSAKETPVIRLADYEPPHWLVDKIELDFQLASEETRVTSRMTVRPNPEIAKPGPFRLDGDGLSLDNVAINGVPLMHGDFGADREGLTIVRRPEGAFRLEIRNRIDPASNTKLMGLYRTGGIYCTQCEAEGFRRITYFPDRPDVLSVYTVRIEARKGDAPILLANGNRIDGGDIEGTDRHFAVWHDPFPKPSYLFAMVAGELGVVRDSFTTMSGREVALEIYCEPGNEANCDYAMGALKRSMRWDEERFGREYDLDIFMIVAVSDFNMGAMENKGLNVFNDKYILASPDTATDADYSNIEAIIAHEYFHNWTGNRITCRDWFQLCLKEGLTVFRDQEFTGDMRSAAVKRIQDVRLLRSHQFPEDAGPLAHPVRPDRYREINNFYTATVYEKGAELIRMLRSMIGDDAFARGMDLYFERMDGTAATIEQFVACFEDAAGQSLDRFMRWYEQAGTPQLTVTRSYDEKARRLDLAFRQMTPPTPGQSDKAPVPIAVRLGLVGANGEDVTLATDRALANGDTLVVGEAEETVSFADVPANAVPSLLRGFSAPVRLTSDLSASDLAFLMRHDCDPFNRWEAAQSLMGDALVAAQAAIRRGEAPQFDARLAEAISETVLDESFDPAYRALFLSLPGETEIAQKIGSDVDPDAIHRAVRAMREALAAAIGAAFETLARSQRITGGYSPNAADAGKRSLRNAALSYLSVSAEPAHRRTAASSWSEADNMTDRLAALTRLVHDGHAEREEALKAFAERHRGNPLVLDKWLTVQATAPGADTLDTVRRLAAGAAFDARNPNRVRALIGAFATANPPQFARANGEGFDFVARQVIELDRRNPQVAARMMGAFRSWRSLEAGRRAHAEAAIRSVAAASELSRDLSDIVTRTLERPA
ncbi:MAG: aminopeptidase N [Flavobacteriaceae bacterium]